MAGTKLTHRLANRLFLLLVLCAIFSAIAAQQFNPEWRWLHYLTKPTATALLLLIICQATNPVSKPYQAGIAIGLLFSIGGDFFLMLPQDYFLTGLVCFLLTHCAYIYALTRDCRFAAKPLVFISFTVIAALIILGLWTSLPESLRIPVVIYALVLAAMAAQAMVRWLTLSQDHVLSVSARLAAIGGLLFVISDSLLAYGRFTLTIPLNPLWVLGTYYAAQWLFARSVFQDKINAQPAA